MMKIQLEIVFLLYKKENFRFCKIKNSKKDSKQETDLDKSLSYIIQKESKQSEQKKTVNYG